MILRVDGKTARQAPVSPRGYASGAGDTHAWTHDYLCWTGHAEAGFPPSWIETPVLKAQSRL